ncbi:MAG TPA: DUF3999 family protein [Pseudacidobacterium sp.]|jgi:hypothetical protein|nr:DUF3999 family protein [Pseudacidobacterium sp.]
MNVRLLPVLLLLAVQPEQRYFRYQRPVTGIPAQQKQTCATLDVTAFAHASAGLADLRLYHDEQETPYALHVSTPLSTEHAVLQLVNLGSRNGNVAFDAEMPPGSYSTIQLGIERKDFIASVDVAGSQTQSASDATHLGSFTVFDLTGQRLGRSMVLHLPVSDFRYLHFTVGSPVKPEDVTGVSVEREPLETSEYLTVAESKQIAQQGRSSVIEFSVPANIPVDRVAFVPAESASNFSRSVSVEITPEQGSKIHLQTMNYSGEIRRVHGMHSGRRIDDERLAVDINSAGVPGASKWTVKIDNGDDLPLALAAVRLQMQKQDICFDATPDKNYMLYYGDAALSTPQYDYATLFQPDKDAAQATLGPEQDNPQYKERADTRPFTERHPALLWIALVLAVVVLGGVALRSAKRVG